MNTATLFLALALAAGESSPPAPNAAPAATPPAETAPAPAAAPSTPAGVLSLAQALKEAQEKNWDLKQAQARLRQVDQAWYKVLAQYLPQISFGGSYTRNEVEASFSLPTGYWLRDMSGLPAGAWDRTNPTTGNGPDYDPTKGLPTTPPDSSNPPGAASNTIMYPSGFETLTIQKQNQFGGQLSLQQALIVPALWPMFHIADLGKELATESTEVARREILFAVAQLYYGAVSLKQLIDVQERLLKNNLAHEKDAKVRVDAGAMPKIVLIRAQIDRARAEQDLVRAKVSYDSAKVALSTLLDHQGEFDVAQPEEPKLTADRSQLEDLALKDRPDLAAAKTNLELAQKSKTAVYYQYLPNILGKFTYQGANLKGFTDSYFQWSISVLASWTIWDGGTREATLRENEAKIDEALAALHGSESKAKDEVKRALLDLDSARANRSKAEEQARLARENMQLVTVNYNAGAATQIDVSDANTALESSELGLVAETLNSQLAALKVLKAAGQFNPRP